jgi:hypothetical protein
MRGTATGTRTSIIDYILVHTSWPDRITPATTLDIHSLEIQDCQTDHAAPFVVLISTTPIGTPPEAPPRLRVTQRRLGLLRDPCTYQSYRTNRCGTRQGSVPLQRCIPMNCTTAG